MNPTRRDLLNAFSAAAATRAASADSASLPSFDTSLGRVRIYTEGRDLIVETGMIQRRWRITSNGFVTTAFTNVRTGKSWAASPSRDCDWSLAGFGLDDAPCQLNSLSARPVRFDPYTSDRLEAVAEFAYPGLTLRWTVWAYPDASGIRTQLAHQPRNVAKRTVTVPADGNVSFELRTAPEFGFYRCEPVEGGLSA